MSNEIDPVKVMIKEVEGQIEETNYQLEQNDRERLGLNGRLEILSRLLLRLQNGMIKLT